MHEKDLEFPLKNEGIAAWVSAVVRYVAKTGDTTERSTTVCLMYQLITIWICGQNVQVQRDEEKFTVIKHVQAIPFSFVTLSCRRRRGFVRPPLG